MVQYFFSKILKKPFFTRWWISTSLRTCGCSLSVEGSWKAFLFPSRRGNFTAVPVSFTPPGQLHAGWGEKGGKISISIFMYFTVHWPGFHRSSALIWLALPGGRSAQESMFGRKSSQEGLQWRTWLENTLSAGGQGSHYSSTILKNATGILPLLLTHREQIYNMLHQNMHTRLYIFIHICVYVFQNCK